MNGIERKIEISFIDANTDQININHINQVNWKIKIFSDIESKES